MICFAQIVRNELFEKRYGEESTDGRRANRNRFCMFASVLFLSSYRFRRIRSFVRCKTDLRETLDNRFNDWNVYLGSLNLIAHAIAGRYANLCCRSASKNVVVIIMTSVRGFFDFISLPRYKYAVLSVKQLDYSYASAWRVCTDVGNARAVAGRFKPKNIRFVSRVRRHLI